jgi:HEPN domain-containing protein
MGMVLDRFYIPTRYPNGLPDITPDVAFTNEDADTCIAYSRKIIDEVRSILNY